MKKITIKFLNGETKEFIYDSNKPEETIEKFLITLENEIGLGINDVLSIKWEVVNDRDKNNN